MIFVNAIDINNSDTCSIDTHKHFLIFSCFIDLIIQCGYNEENMFKLVTFAYRPNKAQKCTFDINSAFV